MNKKAAALVQAFIALAPKEQSEVIDLIAEYYLARPKHRQALLQRARRALPGELVKANDIPSHDGKPGS
jgi:hypothetical protein